MRLAEVETAEDAERWRAYLDERWPTRPQMIKEICRAVGELGRDKPQVLELCCGAGLLGQALLDADAGSQYWGVDLNGVVLEAAGRRLAPWDARAQLTAADLNAEWDGDWSRTRFDAVVSLQALHDLGAEAQVEGAYARAAAQLAPGGLLLNADLVDETGERPGRMPAARHLELMNRHGLERTVCTFDDGVFVCCLGYAPV
jgi:predicted TPR repeat methyltransferase